MAQAVDHLPNKHKALSSNPNTAKNIQMIKKKDKAGCVVLACNPAGLGAHHSCHNPSYLGG
jgi:hypothetical protein